MLVAAALLHWLTTGLPGVAIGAPLDESKPYGRACIALSTGEITEPLRIDSKPGSDSYIRIYAMPNARCRILAFAFNASDGKLANDWPPQYFEVQSRQEIVLPYPLSAWRWPERSEPFELHVLFLHPNSKAAPEIRKLVAAMQEMRVDRALLARQAIRLRELATGLAIEPTTIANLAKSNRTEIGATYRDPEFPWRKYSTAVNFSEDKPGLLILRHKKPNPSSGEPAVP